VAIVDNKLELKMAFTNNTLDKIIAFIHNNLDILLYFEYEWRKYGNFLFKNLTSSPIERSYKNNQFLSL